MDSAERRHLNVRLEVQLETVALNPDELEAADELERIRTQLLTLDLIEQEREAVRRDPGNVSAKLHLTQLEAKS